MGDEVRLEDKEPRRRRGASRTYASDRIEVTWEPRLCVHVGECFQGLPDVFDPWSRPWVRPDAADPEAVAEVVMRCPSGALHFRRLDGGPQEEDLIGEEVELVALADGPMQVRGHAKLVDAEGQTIREDTRMVLCRCGSSRTKPLCDGTHRVVGFKDPLQ
ncbi:MAG TPA: (4Fe-4S)-binding protein [Actinomycetota bacterium]|nr:(4Fe-4S)-binding protein [Actinomycetota bacterium]